MKVLKRIDRLSMKETMVLRFVAYDYDHNKLEVKICRWYLYPFCRFPVWLNKKRIHFYHFLNDIGIMHTPYECVMQLSDIWRKGEK